VTVAFDTDIEAARPFYEAAHATHPSLVDPALSLVAMFGMTNVPFGVWIDEDGTIVRHAEVAFAGTTAQRPSSGASTSSTSSTSERDQRDERAAAAARAAATQPDSPWRPIMEAMGRNIGDRTRYAAAVRDWVAKGADSTWVLSPDEVIARSRPCPPEAALAAAEFEIGQHLHRTGYPLDAVPHFARAHELDPENWSYPRQSYALVDPDVGQDYGTDLPSEIVRVGADTFYPSLDM
jgi:hypothetical protein